MTPVNAATMNVFPPCHFKSVVLVALLVVSFGNAASAVDDTKGVDVGGYKLHVMVAGSGSPAVVFENGLGEPLDTWKTVQPEVAKLTTTISYDRGGLGNPTQRPGPRQGADKISLTNSIVFSRQSRFPARTFLSGIRWEALSSRSLPTPIHNKLPVWSWWILKTVA